MLAFVGAALADFALFLLHLLKDGPFNDRLVDVLEDDAILTVILQLLFVLVGLELVLKLRMSPQYSCKDRILVTVGLFCLVAGCCLPFPGRLMSFFSQ